MAVLSKMHMKNAMYGLFVLLTLVLLLNPSVVKNMYGSVLGRLLFLILVIFFTMHNSTLGLLLVLVVIVTPQMYSREGMETKDEKAKAKPDDITGALDALKANPDIKTKSAAPVTTPVKGAAAVPDVTKQLTATLANLKDIVDKTKPADRITTEKFVQGKESFTMMGTTFKTHNPDVAPYSQAAPFSSF